MSKVNSKKPHRYYIDYMNLTESTIKHNYFGALSTEFPHLLIAQLGETDYQIKVEHYTENDHLIFTLETSEWVVYRSTFIFEHFNQEHLDSFKFQVFKRLDLERRKAIEAMDVMVNEIY